MTRSLEVTEHYLLIINALRCLGTDDGWLIVGSLNPQAHSDGQNEGQNEAQGGQEVVRKVISLDDIKGEYQAELKGMDARLQQLMTY